MHWHHGQINIANIAYCLKPISSMKGKVNRYKKSPDSREHQCWGYRTHATTLVTNLLVEHSVKNSIYLYVVYNQPTDNDNKYWTMISFTIWDTIPIGSIRIGFKVKKCVKTITPPLSPCTNSLINDQIIKSNHRVLRPNIDAEWQITFLVTRRTNFKFLDNSSVRVN